MLKQTDSGIYYLHDYIPRRLFNRYSQQDIQTSMNIWAYKDGYHDALNLYTNELMRAIVEITRFWGGNKIGLIAVPPSKVGKTSTIETSIWNIERWYNEGITKSVFNCDKTFYDYSHLLTRNTDVPTSHRGIRPNYATQKSTISCSRNHLSKYWTSFILLDDVTTTETSMNACYDILIENGAKEQYIKKLVIARTVER